MEVFLKSSLSLSDLWNKCLMDVLNSYFYLDESNYSLFQTYQKNQGKKADRKAN